MNDNVQICTVGISFMNWDDLKVVLAVSRCGTLSGAAVQLKIQHTTVSRRIKSLEKKLGTNLVRRNKGVYELTKAGIKIRDAALKIETEITSIDGTVIEKDAPLSGPLRVTTINSMASSILMPMFSAFSKKHPLIELHIMVSNTTASLTNREADIAIRLSNSPAEMLIGKRVLTVSSTLYGSTDYLAEQRRNGNDLNWLGVTCCGFHKSWTRESCTERVHQFNCDDALLTVAALREGLGISYLPCFTGDTEPLLERYCDPDEKFDLGLWVLIHPESKSNARILAFRDFITTAIEEQHDLFVGLI
jgi:DNA-binding transcriptional LysR family regulator